VPRIALIGAGEMAREIGTRLMRYGGVSPEDILASHYRPEKGAAFERATGIKVVLDNAIAASHSDVIVLCVRPQQVRTTLRPMVPLLRDPSRSLVSIAVGIRVATLAKWAGSTQVVHFHPTSLLMATELYNPGVSLWVRHPAIDSIKAEALRKLFETAIGEIWEVPERQLPKYIFLTGNCPALLLRTLAAFVAASGVRARARDLYAPIVQSLYSGLVVEGRSPLEIIKRIATPRGVTEAGLRVLEKRYRIDALARELRRACTQRLRGFS